MEIQDIVEAFRELFGKFGYFLKVKIVIIFYYMTKEQFKLVMQQGETDTNLPENLDDLMKKDLIIPSLVQRWTRLFVEQNSLCEKLKIDRQELYGKLVYDYRFNKPVAWDGKQMEAQILADPQYLVLVRNLEEQKYYLNYIEETMNTVKGLGFTIRDFLSYKKMLLGST